MKKTDLAQGKISQAIIVSGTPGTGKSSLARELSLLLHIRHLDGTLFVKSEGLGEFDKATDSLLVSPKRLNKALILAIMQAKKPLVIDSHLAHYLPKKYVKLCVVTKCSLTELQKRLKKRGYSQAKIRENLDAEIFDVCLTEAREKGHEILVVDTTKTRAKTLAKIIARFV